MNVVVYNRSRKKAFRRTKRIISSVLPSISNRVNLGNLPRRVILELVTKLRHATTKGVRIKLFFEESEGYRGFKCIEFGTKDAFLREFVEVDSRFDADLKAKGLLKTP